MMNKLILGNHSRLFLSMFLIGMLVWMLIPAQEARAATITVNSAADNLTAADGFCTLREAVRNANLSLGGDITGGDCTAGSAGADTITFALSITTPITLTIAGTGEGAAATGDLDITDHLTITGNGASNTIINGNSIDRVFQISDSTSATFNDLRITGGGGLPSIFTTEEGSGAAILSRGTLILNRVRVTGNTAAILGGGLYGWVGSITINDSIIDDNFATQSGGGIYTVIDLTINNSTISGNRANNYGGGIRPQSGTTIIYYSTIANNIADFNGSGGESGGGIAQGLGSAIVFFRSSIIADNSVNGSGDPDCFGTLSSPTYTVIENTTGCTLGGTPVGNVTGIDPGLGTLADNGGPTLTHALATNSPAIDLVPSGTNGCGTTYTLDQRGYTRPIDGDGDTTLECDSGAYESLQVCSVTDNTSYPLGNVTFFVPTGQAGNIACFQVSEIAKNHPNATTNLETGMYWLLEAQDSSGAAATGFSINLTIGDAGLTFTPDADDKLCRWNGSLWDCDASGFTISPDTLTRNGVTALSPWTAGNNVGPTAITLETLTARAASTPLTLLALALLTLALLFFISRKRDMARS